MRLRVSKPDPQSPGQRTHLGIFSDITDEGARKHEILESDTIQIEGILYKRDEGIFQLQLSIGGHDAADVYHKNLKFKDALISLVRDREQDKAQWRAFDLDKVLEGTWDAMKQFVQQYEGTKACTEAVWRITGLESEIVE
jgi:hypothetical protein